MISKQLIEGFEVFVKENDSSYKELFLDFLNYNIKIKKVFRSIEDTKVFLVDSFRGPVVIKVFVPKAKKVERFIKSFVKRDYYENLIIQTDRVRNEGINSVNDYYLLAEKKINHYTHIYIMIIEYIEGKELHEFNTIPNEILNKIEASIHELHEHNMVSGDPHHGNFIISDNEVRLIDLSGKKCNAVRKAKDRIDLERHFGINNYKKDYGYYKLTYKKKVRYFIKSIKYKMWLTKSKPH